MNAKPEWLRKLHATGIHGQPAEGCTICQLSMSPIDQGDLEDSADMVPVDEIRSEIADHVAMGCQPSAVAVLEDETFVAFINGTERPVVGHWRVDGPLIDVLVCGDDHQPDCVGGWT